MFFINIFFFIFIFFFCKIFTINSNILDFFFKVNFNDSYFNLYSFFWTNFWYLPIFFFFILFLFFNLKLKLLLLLFILYSLEITSISISNFNLFKFNSIIFNFNVFLLNSINKYHPFIFYVSSLLVLAIYKYCLNFNDNLFSFENNFFKIFFYFNFIFYFNFVSLFLGSWWAMQEGSWGGWWNWDASETLGLLILFFFFSYLHYKINIFYTLNIFYYFITFTLFIIFIYYFVQLNFDLVSHNFGIKFFFFF